MITQELLQDRLAKLQRGFERLEKEIMQLNQQMTQLSDARVAQIGAISELQELLKLWDKHEAQAQKTAHAAEQGIGPVEEVLEMEAENRG